MQLHVLVKTPAQVCSYEKIAERFDPEDTVCQLVGACCQVPEREPLSGGVKGSVSRSLVEAALAAVSRGTMKSRTLVEHPTGETVESEVSA